MFQRLIPVVLCVIVVLASIVASVKSWVETSLDKPLNVPVAGYILNVPAGSSLSQLSRELAGRQLIDSRYPLLVHARLQQIHQIQVGEYLLEPGITLRKLIRKFVNGDVILFRVTFPEGHTLKQWLTTLNDHERFASQPLALAELSEEFKPPQGENLEGWFFPDTYSFRSSEPAVSVLHQAHQKMVEVLREEWAGRSQGLPLKTPYEALILASIIEKETGQADERPAIAGVFIRRLQQGMRLQTDPTVIYGLGERFDGDLTRAHLQDENSYNTYVIQGLPPTPIANPGRESIHAALHPKEGTELYFVGRGDGSHQFSTTLDEHQRAVRKFQLERVEHYRSAPQ